MLGKVLYQNTSGESEANIYSASLILPNGFSIPYMRVMACDDSLPVDMLIGMDIIQLGTLIVNTFNGETVVSFHIPSPGYIVLSPDYISPKSQLVLPTHLNW
jgi:hypothetical protein